MEFAQAKALIRGRIEQEFTLDYPVLRRIPDEYLWRGLAVVDCLAPNERSDLFDLFAERGCLLLETNIGAAEWDGRYNKLCKNLVLERYRHSIATQLPWKYADPQYMRLCLDNWRRRTSRASDAPHSAPPRAVRVGQRTWRAVEPAREPSYSPVPLAVVEAAESPKQCNAREIRAAVKRSFAGRFKMKQVNAKQGNWRYPGEFQNRLFTLTLDWNWMGGPRYGLVIGRHNLDYSAPPFAWETLLGFGTGSWDFLCEHNLADSIELLGQIIETAVTLLPNTLSNYPGGKVV